MEKVSLLLVDDNKLFQDLSTQFLGTFEGIGKIDIAQSAQEALKKAHDIGYNFYVIEFVLPDRKGVDIIPDIRKISPKSKIVILTHSYIEAYHQAGMKGGADLVLNKEKIFSDLIPFIQSQTSEINNSFIVQGSI